ncbi:MAG TPA: glucose-6-phosphate isomerase [Firmicutes bacterium]|nr:glucose-6-phosphate isomerase [Bacillota bacterium]
MKPEGIMVVRRLSQMRGAFQDHDAAERMVAESDPVIYRVYNVVVPEESGQLQFCTSIIYPGRVGDEYFMTKGHFHQKIETAEVYLTLQGQGLLLMQSDDGRVATLDMFPGSTSYIPPRWAHRSINVGSVPLVLYAVYPGDAGHNYGIIEEKGFSKIVVAGPCGPVVMNNPRYSG